MAFDYEAHLPQHIYRQIHEIKAFAPQLVYDYAAARPRPRGKDGRLVLAAADHNARMITEYAGHPLGLSNHREYLSRLLRMLSSPQVDGVEASPDVIEDLLILSHLSRENGGEDFLAGKTLIGTVNRGGLKNSAWELDDFCSGFTLPRLNKLRLDGLKFMVRIDLADQRSKNTLQYCTDIINQAEQQELPVFVEVLMAESGENGIRIRQDTVSLCRSAGVVSALGCTSLQKWLEIPRNEEYQAVAQATTCPVLVVPDESAQEPLSIIHEYTREMGLADNIRGILLGRNILYHMDDPYPLAHTIAALWHGAGDIQQLYSTALEQKHCRLFAQACDR